MLPQRTKGRLLIAFMLLLLPLNADAGWTRQQSGIGKSGFIDIHAVSANFAAMVGIKQVMGKDKAVVKAYEKGGLARTVDQGVTWQPIFKGQARAVADISFVDASFGWLVSNSMSGATFESTVDGGLTWTALSVPAKTAVGGDCKLVAVRFFDRCEGWVAANCGSNDGGVLWYTNDGGKTLSEVADRTFLTFKIFGLPVPLSLSALAFADRSKGWAAGSYEAIFRYVGDKAAPACSSGNTGPGGADEGGCDCSYGPFTAPPAWPLIMGLWAFQRRRSPGRR